MKSILESKACRVLKYFNKYNFNNINELINLEQYYINTLNPIINVDLIAKGSGFHFPMSNENKLKLQELRGTKIYIICNYCFNLIYIFNSKQDLFKNINLHYKTLNKIINNSLYLNLYLIKTKYSNNNYNNLINKIELILLFKILKLFYIIKIPHSKPVIAEFISDNYKLNNNFMIKEFNSINSLVKYLKGDKSTITKYLNQRNNNKLYRGH
jgi:hypothetical protein